MNIQDLARAWNLTCVVGMTYVFFTCWVNGGRAGFSIIEYGEHWFELLLFSVLTPLSLFYTVWEGEL